MQLKAVHLFQGIWIQHLHLDIISVYMKKNECILRGEVTYPGCPGRLLLRIVRSAGSAVIDLVDGARQLCFFKEV